MPKRSQRSDENELPDGYRPGADIACEEMSSRVALDQYGIPHVFLHVLAESRFPGQGERLFSISVADRDPSLREKPKFVTPVSGSLHLEPFLTDTRLYRVLEDRYVCLPSGSDNDFGIYQKSHGLDVELTRKVFGCVRAELDAFLVAFSVAVEGFSRDPNWRHSRTTASKRSENCCDLTSAWIPSHFPFIAFGETQYFGGHISLHGFYRLVAFLFPEPRTNHSEREPRGFYRSLLEAGASQTTLDTIKEAALHAYHSPISWEQMRSID